MTAEEVVNSLITLRDKGECVSETTVLDRAIEIIKGLEGMKTDIHRCLANCQLDEEGDCRRCNRNMISSIDNIIDRHIGEV